MVLSNRSSVFLEGDTQTPIRSKMIMVLRIWQFPADQVYKLGHCTF